MDRCRDERQVLRDVDGGRVRCWRAEELRGRLAEGYERVLAEDGKPDE